MMNVRYYIILKVEEDYTLEDCNDINKISVTNVQDLIRHRVILIEFHRTRISIKILVIILLQIIEETFRVAEKFTDYFVTNNRDMDFNNWYFIWQFTSTKIIILLTNYRP